MAELHYELCEQCETNMMAAGAMTSIDEVIETQAEMDFGGAITFLKEGYKVARKGWNGKDMFLYHVPANAYPPNTNIATEAFNGENVPYGAYIAMKTAQGNVVPWLASQTDMLAEDWIVLN